MNLNPLLSKIKEMVNLKLEDFETVSMDFQKIILKKNEIWEQEGKISQLMGFVNQGILRQYLTKEGIEYTTNFFIEEEFIGNYISYQTQTPSTMTTKAIEPCELIVIPFHKFESYYEKIPVTKETAEIVGQQKLLEIQNRSTSLLINTPEERYYHLLKEKPTLINRIPQYLIAQYLGIRPESLSRIRRRHIS